MSSETPNTWEIWHARFDFSDGTGYKFRPVIVLGEQDNGSLVAMVTSATNKLSLEHDYKIRDWEAAGLGICGTELLCPVCVQRYQVLIMVNRKQ